ncbi:GMP/IMP nucleotidase [Marinospirillum minutulum]|uniref:GMP/IMP nucleotidase n=1 Tax=Marinospirillum minutulum TaxID=64974 RepID=UPI0003FA878C|nr:GMP/IMP nucleotidase [Marinospirillum minutulum]
MIDWKNINTVLLDMDGTLLDLHFDSHFWLEHLPHRYAELHKLEKSSVQTNLIAQIMAEKGRLNWYSLDYWSERLGVDILALKREIQHLIGFRVDALDFLQWLKVAHPRVVLATNADRKSLALKLPLTGLEEYVDFIFSSSDIGIPKEDQGYWHALMEVDPFDPATTLLIDDNESVLASAQAFGIAQLITISQPDSHSPLRQMTEFPAVTRFAELQPVNKP